MSFGAIRCAVAPYAGYRAIPFVRVLDLLRLSIILFTGCVYVKMDHRNIFCWRIPGENLILCFSNIPCIKAKHTPLSFFLRWFSFFCRNGNPDCEAHLRIRLHQLPQAIEHFYGHFAMDG